MEDLINHLRTVERTLLAGCTYAELAAAMGASDKTARRAVVAFRSQGCVIDEWYENEKGKLWLKLRPRTRLFRK